MGKYEGYRCADCGEVFKTSDDVVVCPICGAPHHRDCYINKGHCAAEELHEKGENYTPVLDAQEVKGSPCPSCGHIIPEGDILCPHCGKKTSDEQQTSHQTFDEPPINPFSINPDEEISGIKAKELAEYVGPSHQSFLFKWRLSQKHGSSFSLNYPAFFIGPLYFLYRKMFLLGIIYLIFSFISSIPYVLLIIANRTGASIGAEWEFLNSVFSFISLIVQFLAGGFFNKLYLSKAVTDIKNNEIKKGGVSIGASFAAFAINLIISLVFIYLISING